MAFNFPKAPSATIDPKKTPLELPTMPSGLDELESQVQEMVAKVNEVSIEEIGHDMRPTLAELDRSSMSPSTGTSTSIRRPRTTAG